MVKKILRYIRNKYRWGSKCYFDYTTLVDSNSSFEEMTRIHSYTDFKGHIGMGSYIGSYCSLSADIGRFTSIAPYVRCNSGKHPYTYPFVTTSPCFFSLNFNSAQCGCSFAEKQMFKESSYYDEERRIAVKIGSDCWIGEGVFMVGGIIIGDGAVILAHAVVTKNVPDYAIVGGVPAKILGYRYDDKTINFLRRIQWWNNDKDWLRCNWKLLTDMNELKKYYKDDWKD